MRLTLVWIVTIFFECAFAQLNSKVDYQDEVNWAVLPSDTIKPWSPFVETTPFKNVDVFYVYPTLLTDSNDFRWNYDIQDPRHKEGVVNYLVKYQASAWADLGNVYVPFYRQAHFRSFNNLEAGGEAALRMAYEDVKASFQFYLRFKNCNYKMNSEDINNIQEENYNRDLRKCQGFIVCFFLILFLFVIVWKAIE